MSIEIEKDRQGTRETAELVKTMVTRRLNYLLQCVETGKIKEATREFDMTSTFLLRFEYLATRNRMENDLNTLKQRYFDVSIKLGVNL